MNFPRLVLLSLLVFPIGFVSCKKAADAPAAATEGTGGAKAVDGIPEALQAEIEVFGKKLESDLRGKVPPSGTDLWDLRRMAQLIMGDVKIAPQNLERFNEMVMKGGASGLEQAYKGWQDKEVKFKGAVLQNGKPAVRLRIIGEGSGIMMTDLIVEKEGGTGPLKIVNIYDHARDFSFVDQMSQMLIPAFIEEDKSADGKPSTMAEDFKRTTEMAALNRDKQYRKVVELYEQLSPKMKENKMVLQFYIGAALALRDATAYKKAVTEAAERSQGGGFQIVLMGMYLGEKNYDEAIKSVDVLLKNFEKDAALMALKSMLLLNKGEVPAAHALLKEALALEPDCIYVHTTGLDILLAAKDNTGIRDSLIFLEKTGDYDFKQAVRTEAMWAAFKESPEAAAWR